MIDKHDPIWGRIIPLFLETLAEPLEKVFYSSDLYRSQKNYTVFAEWLGPSSFAGFHKRQEPKELVLFDVWQNKFGFIDPKTFVEDFGHLNIPKVIYRGKFTGQFVEDVKNGKYDLLEGVVCKGTYTRFKDYWTAKIKTDEYERKLKEFNGTNWMEYWKSE